MIFCQRFLWNHVARVVTFDMQFVEDELYCGMHRNRFRKIIEYFVLMLTMSSLSLFALCNENNTVLLKQLSGGLVRFSDSSSSSWAE